MSITGRTGAKNSGLNVGSARSSVNGWFLPGIASRIPARISTSSRTRTLRTSVVCIRCLLQNWTYPRSRERPARDAPPAIHTASCARLGLHYPNAGLRSSRRMHRFPAVPLAATPHFSTTRRAQKRSESECSSTTFPTRMSLLRKTRGSIGPTSCLPRHSGSHSHR